MTIGEIQPEEWSQPDGVKLPDHALLRGAKDDEGRLIARSSIISLPHIEGTWVAPGHQVAGLKVLRAIERELAEAGCGYAMAFAPNEQPKIAEYLERMGYKQANVTLWMKEVKCQ